MYIHEYCHTSLGTLAPYCILLWLFCPVTALYMGESNLSKAQANPSRGDLKHESHYGTYSGHY